MNRGIYPILSGAMVQEQRLQVIAHNTANVNTTGYKREDALFGSLLARAGARAGQLRPGEAPLSPSIPSRPSAVPYVFAKVRGLQTDFSSGEFRQTDNPLHVAIQGPGFFEVTTPEGPRYTRSGMFRVDEQQRLVTQQGHPVMGAKGELTLPPGTPSIGQDGIVEVDGRQIGTLKIVEFEDLSTLSKAGPALYSGEDPSPVAAPTVASKHLEGSNVNAVEEMVKLIEVSRLYESAQKVLQTFDRLAEVAISEIGSSA